MSTKLTLGLFAVIATLAFASESFAANEGKASTESDPQIVADNAREQKDADAAVAAVKDEVAADKDEVARDKALGDMKEAADDAKEVATDTAMLDALEKDAAAGGDR